MLMRPLGALQTRLVVVILLSVLPLAAISSLLAWQSYQAASVLGERRVSTTLSISVDHLQLAVAEFRQGAAAVMRDPGVVAHDGCATALRRLRNFNAAPVVAVQVNRHDGSEVCRIGAHAVALADPGKAVPSVGRIGRDADGALVLPVSASSAADDAGPLTVSADLMIPTAFGPDAAWLLLPPAGAAPSRIAGSLPAPRRDTVQRLLGGAAFSTERGRGGALRNFVLGRLPDGTPLVIGDAATAGEARATALLFWRFSAIAILLAAGVLAVAGGAHLTVGRPIRALTRRVTGWRDGEPFDGEPPRFLPTELRDLTRAFGLATHGIVERERALERARGEQDLLFKEIHHRVKNNLQIIASLLNLQASRIRVPEARAEFQSARDRVRALATLHRHLYAEGGLHAIAMRPFLLELCDQLFQAIGEREGTRIRLDVQASALQMSSDQAVPLALVVTEAVSNAIKYAFPAGRAGHVSVRLTELDGDMLELVVQDDGVGIPAGRAETETGIRDGLGIQLIRGFARQLGADLLVTEDGGTRYQLRLKRHRTDEGGAAGDV